MAISLTKEEWKSVKIMSGALSVMICGMQMMLLWCVDNWDTAQLVKLTNFNVGITQFWFYSDAVPFNRAHFGVGTGRIHLDNVGCSGTERRLISCSSPSSVFCLGGHSQDAGVRCQIQGVLAFILVNKN